MNRREFLKLAGVTVAAGFFPWLQMTNQNLSSVVWAAATPDNALAKKRLVVIFLRGAVDGLNVVVPYGEPLYYHYRSSIAVPTPGKTNGVLDLDGMFGMHPSLNPILPLWKERSLAFVHASGSPNDTRSHFDAQEYMESGIPGSQNAAAGWMNRLLGILKQPGDPIQAVSFTQRITRILSGPQSVTNFQLRDQRSVQPLPLDKPELSQIFDQLYTANTKVGRAYLEGETARQNLIRDFNAEMMAANNGAPSATGFASQGEQVGKLFRQDPRIHLAFMEVGGWDTHVNQGAGTGALANNLQHLSEGLLALAHGLGNTYENTVIAVVSEFGRTVHENGDGGTDHGHGNVMWLLGGPIGGGKVYGQWPGLTEDALYQKRDLAITTDFRDVLGTVIQQHMGLSKQNLAPIFPGYSPTSKNIAGLIRSPRIDLQDS